MDEKLEKKLVEQYPDALSEYGGDARYTCMAWGFECGNGWHKIIEELCEKIANIPGFKFAQVKEKFGTLTIYYDGPENEDDRAKVRLAIDEAEIKSSKTCENCGEPGENTNINGWLRTECKMCKTLNEIRLENR